MSEPVINGGDIGEKGMVTKFVNHVFDFGDDSKKDLMNLVQFSVLAIVPLILLNKSIHNVIPEANQLKGSLELSMEILGQLVLMLSGLVLVQRIVTFVPTYSGENYKLGNLVTIILPFLMILLSLQTKMGEKCNILYKRAINTWNGNRGFEGMEGDEDGEDASATQAQNTGVRRTQPIAAKTENNFPSQIPPPPVMSSNRESRPSISNVPPQHSAQSQQAPNQMLGPNALDSGISSMNTFGGMGSAYP